MSEIEYKETNNNVCDSLLGEICIEEYNVKKNSLYLVIFYIVSSIFFLGGSYKNGIAFVLTYLIILYLFIKSILKKKRERIEELNYSKKIILLNESVLNEEFEKGKFNSERNYLLMEHFYIDYNRKNVVKFDEIDNIDVKLSISYVPFIDNYGLNSYVLITTKDNHKIKILNWSWARWYPEDSEVYDIFVNITKNNKNIKK